MGGVFLLLSKISFYGTTFILVILILVLSFKFNKKTEEKINKDVSNEYIASYFDGEYQSEIPGKDDGYVVDKIVCDNGASATWDNEEWGINIRNTTQKIKCSIYFKFQFEQDFDYTGTEQVLTIPKTGTYRLETWGAQGGSHTVEKHGGYGGYSLGTINLKINDNIFINVGGQGVINNSDVGKITSGGYNGGGASFADATIFLDYGASGGGATHIANKSGLLSSLENYKNNILIVSGGGGGSNADTSSNLSTGIGGKSGPNSGGGGSGYYGGGGGTRANDDSSGAGGSGYIGNSLLTNKVMYCYNCEESSEESTKTISTTCTEETPTANCAKKGNGYARITYIG